MRQKRGTESIGSGCVLPRGGAGRAVATPSHLLALKLAEEELASNASN